MFYWLMIIVGSACALLLADLTVHLIYAIIALNRFETLPTFHVQPPPDDAPPYESIQFPTSHGLTLSGGVYFPQDGQVRGVVLFCPETGGSFETAVNYTEALIDAGFAVVSFSFRNHPPSDSMPSYRSNYWVSSYEVDDVNAALDFIESQPQFFGLPIGLFGVSRGAGAALAAGSMRPEIAQVWTQGAFSSRSLSMHHALKFISTVVGGWARLLPLWHVKITIWFMLRICELRNGCRLINLEALLPRWSGREVMFVTGTRDTYVPKVLTEQLCIRSGHSPETSLWLVPHAKHNLERPTSPDEFDQKVVEYFEKMVPQEVSMLHEKSLAVS